MPSPTSQFSRSARTLRAIPRLAEGLLDALPFGNGRHAPVAAVDQAYVIFAGTNNLIDVIGNRTPMTVEDFVIDRKHAFDRNGRRFVPPKSG
jgi:hypothetical protein